MVDMRLFVSATCGAALLAGITAAHAQGSVDQAPAQIDPVAPATVYPGVREYRWDFHFPVMTLDQREIVVDVPEPVVHSRRLNYQAVDVKTERRKLWSIPEFSCKYPDLMLPNQCRTVWRGVYADLPVLVSQERRIDIDVPEWRRVKESFPAFIPHWQWVDRPLIVSVPTIVTEKP
jgi:hypothetical protein